MIIRSINFRKLDFIFLLIFFLAVFSLSYFYEPGVDDLNYHFNAALGGDVRVSSLSDAFSSQCHEYITTNGRFLVHVVIQWLCGCHLYLLFSALNALFATLLVYYIISIIRYTTDKRSQIFDIPVTIALLTLLTPNIGSVFLGNMSMSINYLWCGALYCGFIYYYLLIDTNSIRHTKWFSSLPLLLFALICGTLQESYVIGIGGSLFVYHIIHIKGTKGLELAYLLAFAIGACFLLFAPSNFTRLSASQDGANGLLNGIGTLLVGSIYPAVFSLLAIFLVIYCKKHAFVQWLQGHIILLVAIITLLLFYLFIARTGIHQLTAVFLMVIMMIIELIHDILNGTSKKLENAITIVSTIVLITVFIPVFNIRKLESNVNDKFKDALLCSRDSVVCSFELEDFYCNIMPKSYFGRYNSGHPYRNCSDKLSYYCRVLDGSNLDHVKLALPETISEIVCRCNSHTKIVDCIYKYGLLEDYYIIEAPEYVINIQQVNIVSYRRENITNNIMVHILGKDIKSDVKFDVLNVRHFCYEDKSYFLVKKPSWCVFDNRTNISFKKS